jgi:hypothetical protein
MVFPVFTDVGPKKYVSSSFLGKNARFLIVLPQNLRPLLHLEHTNFATLTESKFALTFDSISANRPTISSNVGRSPGAAFQQSVISSRPDQSGESGISGRAVDGDHERDPQLIQTLRECGTTGDDFKENHPKRENIAPATECVLGRAMAGVGGAHRSGSAAEGRRFILGHFPFPTLQSSSQIPPLLPTSHPPSL